MVASLSDNEKNKVNSITKSSQVICPKCHEYINLNINNYKISLSKCKNNYIFHDLLFTDFSKTYYIDLKKYYVIILKNEINLIFSITNFSDI